MAKTALEWASDHPFLTFFLISGALGTVKVAISGWPEIPDRDDEDDDDEADEAETIQR